MGENTSAEAQAITVTGLKNTGLLFYQCITEGECCEANCGQFDPAAPQHSTTRFGRSRGIGGRIACTLVPVLPTEPAFLRDPVRFDPQSDLGIGILVTTLPVHYLYNKLLTHSVRVVIPG